MLHRITELLERDWVVPINYTYRETNCYADLLANIGAAMDLGVHWLSTPPIDLFRQLQADTIRVSLPCFCIAS